jgi:hypothetical protein
MPSRLVRIGVDAPFDFEWLVKRDEQSQADAERNQRDKEVSVGKNCGGLLAVCHLRTDSRITSATRATLERGGKMLYPR